MPVARLVGRVKRVFTPRAQDRELPAQLHGQLFYRLLGATLLLLVALPVYRLLDHQDTGSFGASTVGFLGVYYELMWLGTVLVLVLALAAGRYLPAARVELAGGAAARWLTRFSQPGFACALALLAGTLTALFSLVLLDGKPNFIDSIAQLQHARLWSAGTLAGPDSDGGGFWNLHNMLITEQGWVSQYPPGHVAVLALFVWLGIPWAAGPVLVALSVLCLSLFADRLFAQRLLAARLGAVFLAASPFFLALGGSYMNHGTSAACLTFGAYAVLRAWQGRPRWSYAAGLSFACGFATRPLSALVVGLVIGLGLRSALAERGEVKRFGSVAGRIALGALPVLVLLFFYNAHFFGGPLASGYTLTHGTEMRLGFHRDPWGNWYGIKEALAYTSADLILLAVNLLETPLPAVGIIAAFLLLSSGITRSERAVAAWAITPVAANALYWHHGIFMGPRMLYEAAPAWALLLAVAIVRLHEQIGRDRHWLQVFHARTAFMAALIVSGLVGALYLAPQRLNSYGGRWLEIMRLPPPQVQRPTLVFVHEAWARRISAQLVAAGMPQHDAETALRQNSTCVLQRLIDAQHAGDDQRVSQLRAGIDLQPRNAELPQVDESIPGAPVRVMPRESLTDGCVRQMNSDREGVLDLPPLAWQGDLPGQPARGALFVRDLGPERNAHLLRQFPHHIAAVYALNAVGGEPVLYSYEQGMARLWGAVAVPPRSAAAPGSPVMVP